MPDDVSPLASTAAATHSALQVKGLDHVVLRVADMDRAIATRASSKARPKVSSSPALREREGPTPKGWEGEGLLGIGHPHPPSGFAVRHPLPRCGRAAIAAVRESRACGPRPDWRWRGHR